MMGRTAMAAALATTVLALFPAAATTQVRASERAMVSQTVDGTVISVDYSRPQARGRSPLFGGPVKWDRPWTGANEATVLELNRDVTIEGTDVPAGRWSVWMVPSQDGAWELFLDPRDDLWHTSRPEPTDEQIRFPIQPGTGDEHVEALTWSFPRVAADGATLMLAWGTTRVPLDIGVEPFYATTVAADVGRAYAGSWTMRFDSRPDDGDLPFEVSYTDDNEIRALTMYPTPEGVLAETELLLLPRAEGIFVPAIMDDGRLVETAEYIFFEFEYDGDRPTSFVLRWAENDAVAGSGSRSDAVSSADPRT